MHCLDIPLPSFWEVIPSVGHYEQVYKTTKFDKASPRGMPHTAWGVKNLTKILRDDYASYNDRVLAYIFLREMSYIARGMIPKL
jgi:hypothetical protein